MVQIDTKSIILTAIPMVTILTLILLNLSIDGFSQTLQTPDFQSNSNIDKSEIMNNTQAELTTKIQLEPHENEYLDDYYQVSDFAFGLVIQANYVPLVIVNTNLKMELCKLKEIRVKDRYQEE